MDSHLRPRPTAQEVTMGKQKRSAVVLEPDLTLGCRDNACQVGAANSKGLVSIPS